MEFANCAPNTGPTPELVSELDEAIERARASIPALRPDAENTFLSGQQKGRKKPIKYVTLQMLIDSIQAPLAAEGVTFSTAGVYLPGQPFAYATTLRHKNGGFRVGYFPVTNPDAQKIGGTQTYCQRYNLMGLLALPIEKDDDGNTATFGPESQRNRPQQNGVPTHMPAESANGNRFGLINELR